MSEHEDFKDFLERELGTDYYDDFTEGGFHAAIKYAKACVESKDKVIEQQAAELAALRELLYETQLFIDELPKDLVKGSLNGWKSQIIQKLMDETGKPTKLLTGEE